jgi:hypothetical protein
MPSKFISIQVRLSKHLDRHNSLLIYTSFPGTAFCSETSRLANYILGKTPNGVGYFHLETRDAQEILYARVRHRIQTMKWDIACQKAGCHGITTRAFEDEEGWNHSIGTLTCFTTLGTY